MITLTNVLLSLLTVLGPSSASRAWGEAVDPSAVLPRFEVVGRETPALRARLDEARARMTNHLRYWRDRGLVIRSKLDAVYVFDDAGALTVGEIIARMNPHAPDVRADLRRQRTRLERTDVIRAIDAADPDVVKRWGSREHVIENVLDYYCGFTYGFMVRNTAAALESGATLSDVKAHPILALHEGASFQRVYPVDVTRLLTGATRAAEAPAKDEVTDMARAAHAAGRVRNQLLIMPRLTQRANDADLDGFATITDDGVMFHELGHWMLEQVVRDARTLPKTLEELFADYAAAAPTADPLIGAGFARAGGVVADRVGSTLLVPEASVNYLLNLRAAAARGSLRDLSRDATVDTIGRHFTAATGYGGGDPGRAFLWRSREGFDAPMRERLDELTLAVVRELGSLPMIVTPRSVRRIERRERWNERLNRATEATLHFAYATFNHGRRTERRAMAEVLLNGSPTLLSRYTDGTSPARRRQVRRESIREVMGAVTLHDGFNWNLRRGSFVRAGTAAVDAHLASTFAGLRPAVEADYALPEMFRAYLRLAEASAPDLVPRLRTEAERAMAASAVRFDLGEFGIEYAFVRGGSTVTEQIAHPALSVLLMDLVRLRSRIDGDRSADRSTVASRSEYADRLDRLHEFERTGAWPSLLRPWRSCARRLTRGGS